MPATKSKHLPVRNLTSQRSHKPHQNSHQAVGSVRKVLDKDFTHKLLNHLTVIRGSADLIRRMSEGDSAAIKKLVKTINRQAKEMEKILRKLRV